MSTLIPQVRPISDQVWDQLQTLTAVNLFDGEVPGSPPLDPDGRVHAYAVFYPGIGRGYSNRGGGTAHSLNWGCQVTCVGGDRTRALWCVDQVRGVLDGLRVTVAGRNALLVDVTPEETPLRRDPDISPPRFYLPLLYRTSI